MLLSVNELSHSHTMTSFDRSGKEAILQAISPFPTMFSTLSKTDRPFSHNVFYSIKDRSIDRSKMSFSVNKLHT